MARKRASMREGPLAELFRATEAAQRGQTDDAATGTPEAPGREEAEATSAVEQPQLPLETPQPEVPDRPVDPDATVEHVYDFEVNRRERRGEPEVRLAPAPDEAPTIVERAPEPVTPPRVEAVPAPVRPEPVRAAGAGPRADGGALHAAGQQIRQPDAGEPAAAARRGRRRLVPRRDPRRRRRRCRHQRRQPDDGRGHRAGRLRRGQHRRAAARALGRPGQAPYRRVAHAGPRLGRGPGHGPPRRRGGLRPDPHRAARERHGVRHRR